MLTRRTAIKVAFTAGATATLTGAFVDANPPVGIIDSNISLFRWPFRRLPLDNATKLVSKLTSLGVHKALAGSFEGLLHRDIALVNQRLADECRPFKELDPIGCVNPALPDWERDLQRCKAELGMSGIRLFPNYHGYALDDDRFAKLLALAGEANLFVQIASAMEDGRTQHPDMQVPDVDLAPLALQLKAAPNVRVQILNHRLRGPLLQQLAALPNVYFATARVDGTDGVPVLTNAVPAGRVLYGSHAPFLIPEAAMIRVHESGQLSDDQLRAVYGGNAERFLNRQ